MKRLVSLTTITLSLLLVATPKTNALEIANKSFTHTNSSLLAAKTQTEHQFVTAAEGNDTVGTFEIIEENGQRYIEFSDDFQTAQGPDLEIILHKAQTVPVSIAEESYITLAPIQSFTGTQRYAIPNDVDLDEYGSVAVWCEEFNVTFGYAQL